jgi:hypothetical protein
MILCLLVVISRCGGGDISRPAVQLVLVGARRFIVMSRLNSDNAPNSPSGERRILTALRKSIEKAEASYRSGVDRVTAENSTIKIGALRTRGLVGQGDARQAGYH